ncbi:uncharacterized protein LOC108982548 [Juglans regia]|uniref:Uncharacterized protein LOC108982548 n=2 Tax=Juglans regia TaxID=51240 RepID=A0A2I4DQS6_JUGRE|nr:uncharacterized protein LOC108982548 [Juglans regia]
MIQSKKYSSGISSHQSIDIIMKNMQQIHLGQTGKVKPKVHQSFQTNSKMKVEVRNSIEIRSSTKVQMPSTNFQSSVKIRKEKMEMIQSSNSSGHTSRNVGRQLMLPSKETSKGQGQNTRPVRKCSNHHSGSCQTTRTSTKSSTREEQKSTETRKHYYRKP